MKEMQVSPRVAESMAFDPYSQGGLKKAPKDFDADANENLNEGEQDDGKKQHANKMNPETRFSEKNAAQQRKLVRRQHKKELKLARMNARRYSNLSTSTTLLNSAMSLAQVTGERDTDD